MEEIETYAPVVARRRLAAELRRARVEAGLTQEQAASVLDWSVSKLVRVETGSAAPSIGDLKHLLSCYGVTDDTRVAEFAALNRASKPRRDCVRRGYIKRASGAGRRMPANLYRDSACA